MNPPLLKTVHTLERNSSWERDDSDLAKRKREKEKDGGWGVE